MSELDTDRKPSRRLWIIAGVIALALHLGGAALALANLRGDDEEALGSEGEFAVEMTAPNVEDTDLPAGPDQDASVAAPALAEQKAVVKDTDVPKDTPTETEDPDRIVTTTEAKKPKKEDDQIAAVQTSASTESVAQEATAQQKRDNAREGQALAAPNQGIGKDSQKMIENYERRINAYLQSHLRYPDVKDPKEIQSATVSFALDRLGHVISVEIAQGSGDPVYDAAAIDMVRRSDPLPVPPPLIADRGLAYNLPVHFVKKKKP